jgi:hypothetical protein
MAMETGVISTRLPWGAGRILADADQKQISFLAGVVNKPWRQVLNGLPVRFERYVDRDEAKRVIL